ncbi:MAG: hypothetical protein IKE38_03635 [Erysipelotrichaceae bacterium]|nr:hypothetical protein [Erysipelotrichaceae bacterium]
MKNKKTLIILFVAVSCLFLFSAFNGARAALITSDDYQSEFGMYDIGVTLNENGDPIAWRNYDQDSGDWSEPLNAELLTDLTKVNYGTVYDEVLTVTNSGQIDEYVRVTIYKYWVDENGNKVTDLDPYLIHLGLTEDERWMLDERYSTTERTVLYYALPLAGSESGEAETTPAFCETVMLDGSIKNYIVQTESEVDSDGYTVVTNVYKYDGKTFCIDVEVDAIQTHNAPDAALSAWGRKISVASDGSLSLVQ